MFDGGRVKIGSCRYCNYAENSGEIWIENGFQSSTDPEGIFCIYVHISYILYHQIQAFSYSSGD